MRDSRPGQDRGHRDDRAGSRGRLHHDDRTGSRGRLHHDDRTGSRGRLRHDDRAVSVTVGYVLTLAIASLLLSGLFIAGGSFVDTERERAAQGQLSVIGERLAADLMTVDRLAGTAESPANLTVDRPVTLPPRVSGAGYRITVTTTGAEGTEGTIRLESDRTDAIVEVPFRTRSDTEIRNATVTGGDLRIRWDPTAGADGAVVVSES
ncbi:hypothetical protein C461_04997 [Halorubrum aidingense JCM 13560]|uniref:Uncharacterized protein n=1 Tax=Halorubrum aidingense JCM 13560 TaxID=1230454 RepID=M0PJP2_9EURY|nr:hypothetical protein [Halorubrum aidingense]EMA68960.1 hypothetical protein C461_04997 [Halorubrum aidingense JCM 13560]